MHREKEINDKFEQAFNAVPKDLTEFYKFVYYRKHMPNYEKIDYLHNIEIFEAQPLPLHKHSYTY